MGDVIKNEIWETISGIGELVVEEVLVVGFEPILFVCRVDSSLDRFLVMTYDSSEGIYVISKIKPYVLCRMLKNEISMDEAFRSTSKIIKTHFDSDNLLYEEKDSCSFEEEFLPRKGAKFELMFDYIDNYIKILESEPCVIYNYQLNEVLSSNNIVDTEYEIGSEQIIETRQEVETKHEVGIKHDIKDYKYEKANYIINIMKSMPLNVA